MRLAAGALLLALLAGCWSAPPDSPPAATPAPPPPAAIPEAFRGDWAIELTPDELRQLDTMRQQAAEAPGDPMLSPMLALMESLTHVELQVEGEAFATNLRSLIESVGEDGALRTQPATVLEAGSDYVLVATERVAPDGSRLAERVRFVLRGERMTMEQRGGERDKVVTFVRRP